MNEKKNESIETKETNEQTPVNEMSREELELVATVEELRAYKCEADEKIATLEKELEEKKKSVSYWMDCYTKARTECDTLKEEVGAIATLAAKLAK